MYKEMGLALYRDLYQSLTIRISKIVSVSHQWCDLFYRLLHSSTRHIEKVEGGERDTQLVHANEATAV
jgi:hypothetical protein